MDRFDYFQKFYNIGVEDLKCLGDLLQHRTFKKGELIIKPGMVQNELYFVNSGIQMSYAETESKVHVLAFTYYPDLCAIPESFLFQTASKHFLVSLTESNLEYITFKDLQHVFDQNQRLERLFRKMTEFMLVGIINRHFELHSTTIEERFKAFCNRSPHLLQSVPHKYIASYLGIDPTNFSKLFNQVKI